MRSFCFFLFFSVFLFIYTTAQSNFDQEEVCDTVYEYKVTHPSIYKMLDSMLNRVNDCIFSKLNIDFYFTVNMYDMNEGLVFNFRTNPYDYCYGHYPEISIEEKGLFFYRNKLVLFSLSKNLSEQRIIQRFFQKTNQLQMIYKYRNTLPESGKSFERVDLMCQYNEQNNSIEIIKDHSNCGGDYQLYYYNIQKGDNWRTLAEKLHLYSEQDFTGKYVSLNCGWIAQIIDNSIKIMNAYRVLNTIDGAFSKKQTVTNEKDVKHIYGLDETMNVASVYKFNTERGQIQENLTLKPADPSICLIYSINGDELKVYRTDCRYHR